MLRRFWIDESGQDLIEYALIAGFMATAGATFLAAVTPTEGSFNAVMRIFAQLVDGGIGQ